MPYTSPNPSFTNGLPTSDGSRAAVTRLRSLVQISGSSSPSSWSFMSTVIRDRPGWFTDRTSLTSDIFWISDSSGSDTSRATCCALAPGYSVITTAVLMVKAGSSSRPRVKNPQMPPRSATSMMSQVRIGRSMEAFAMFMTRCSVREAGKAPDDVAIAQLAHTAGDDFLAGFKAADHPDIAATARLDLDRAKRHRAV